MSYLLSIRRNANGYHVFQNYETKQFTQELPAMTYSAARCARRLAMAVTLAVIALASGTAFAVSDKECQAYANKAWRLRMDSTAAELRVPRTPVGSDLETALRCMPSVEFGRVAAAGRGRAAERARSMPDRTEAGKATAQGMRLAI